MKILYVSGSIVPSRYANSINVMKMCQGLALNGNEVTLVCTKGKSKEDIFEYYNVANRFKVKRTKNYKFSFFNRLIQSIKSSKGKDLIYTRWPLAAIVLCVLTNKKIIFEHHHPSLSLLNKVCEFFLVRAKQVVHHIFITQSLENYYCEKHPKIKLKTKKVLPDGADVGDYTLNFNINASSNKKVECIYMGSFNSGKGIDTVIKIAKEMPEVTFNIVGGTKEEIEALRTSFPYKNLVWHGFLPHKKAINILRKSSIALLPNHPKVMVGDDKNLDIGQWTSPLKMFEYMAEGKAVVASKLSILQEVLANRKNALLVNYDSVNEWVEAIEELKDNKKYLNSLAKQAQEDVINNYTWVARAKKAIKDFQ